MSALALAEVFEAGERRRFTWKARPTVLPQLEPAARLRMIERAGRQMPGNLRRLYAACGPPPQQPLNDYWRLGPGRARDSEKQQREDSSRRSRKRALEILCGARVEGHTLPRLIFGDHDDLGQGEEDGRGIEQRQQDAAAYLAWRQMPTFGLPTGVVEGRWPDQRHGGRLTESPFLLALAGFIAGWLAGYSAGQDDRPAPIEQLAMAHAREMWRNRHIRQNLRPRLATWRLTSTEQQAFLRRAGGASYNQIARELGVTGEPSRHCCRARAGAYNPSLSTCPHPYI